ncbi:oxidoreductase [Devosia pacifica]|uniref:Oxidoreductase n=1 Tax=Devosia pacifica TaxID=1335967 RepID=A0A918VWW1_9HYPH|nr:SDR family NAD(P)-dependent oxidoreductase [Devosia pacifica]GHA36912.1 oxidoreductase [Devosia pacifica]
MADTEKKIAWIIGGGSGIGAASARLLADRGWKVAISGRRREKLDEVAAGRDIHPFPLDVTDADAVADVVAQISRTLGRIDLTIFGAAAWQPSEPGDYAFDKFQKVVDTNLLGVVRLANPLFEQYEKQGGGELAVISSVAGYVGLPRAAAYNATKSSLISLTESMHAEMAPRNINVRVVAPGFFKSELTEKNDFPMPFLLETEDAARRMVDGLTNSKSFEIAFPKRMAFILKFMRMLPYPLFFAITSRMMPKDN